MAPIRAFTYDSLREYDKPHTEEPLIYQPRGSAIFQVGEHPPMKKGTLMNMLAKFDPFTRTEPLDLFQPSFRADTFRDMDDIVRNMQRTFPPWSAQAEELMTHTEWKTSVDISHDVVKY